MLAERDSQGRKIVFTRASAVDAHSPTVGFDILTIHTLVYDVLLQDEENQIRGIVHIGDVAGFQPNHFTIFSPKQSLRIEKNTEVPILLVIQSIKLLMILIILTYFRKHFQCVIKPYMLSIYIHQLNILAFL